MYVSSNRLTFELEDALLWSGLPTAKPCHAEGAAFPSVASVGSGRDRRSVLVSRIGIVAALIFSLSLFQNAGWAPLKKAGALLG